MKQKDTKLHISSLSYLDDQDISKQSGKDTVSLILLSLYLLIPFISNNKYQDFYGLHWFLLSILNTVVGLYLFFFKDATIEKYLPTFLKSKIYLIYISFTVISGLSILMAFNITESLVQYSRLINIVITFTLLGLLFINRRHLFSQIAIILTATTFLEGFFVLQDFYKNEKGLELMPLVLETIKWTTGNKNIFTACLVAKLPFLIYLFITKSGFWKYFSLVTLFISTHVIYLSITRTAFVGMILVFSTFLIGSFIVRKINDKSTTIQVVITSIVFIISCFLAQNKIDSLLIKAQQSTSNTSVTEAENKSQVLAKLGDSEGDVRFKYWEAATEIIKENPLLGVGYGNYKLYTPNYTKYLLGDSTFSKHPHNDFFFVAGESGVFALILYISLFLVAIFILIKNILTSKDNNRKLINLTLLTSLGICLLDALFNFPKERPVAQLLLILNFVLIIIYNLKDDSVDSEETSTKSNKVKLVSIIVILISAAITYTNYIILESMKAQGMADTDYYTNAPAGKPLSFKYEDIKSILPSYPNISEIYEPVDAKLAKYLRAENRFDEAIQTLKATEKIHPNYSERNYTIASIYYHNLKNNDSAYFYITKALKDKPKNFDCVKLATYLMANKGEYTKIEDCYKEFYKYNEENEENFTYYCQVLYTAKYPNEKLNKVVKEALKKYPNNQEIIKLSAFVDLVMLK